LPNSNETEANKGYLAAFASMLFLSTTAIFIHYLHLNFQLPSLVLAFWREVFVGTALLLVFLLFKPSLLVVQRKHWLYLAVFGFALTCFNAFWTLSIAVNGASVATVLAYSSAAFTALLGRIILKETLNLAKWIAVVGSMIGCALVANALDPVLWKLGFPGFLVGIAAGLFYAIYSVMGRSASERGINPWTTLFTTFSIAAVCMLLLNLLFGRYLPGGAKMARDLFWLGNSWAGWGLLLALAVGPTLMGYGFYNLSLQYLPSSIANLVVTIEPLFTAVFAYFLFGERLSTRQILGGATILAAVFMLRIFNREK